MLNKIFDLNLLRISKLSVTCFGYFNFDFKQHIISDLVQKFLGGESIQCKNCTADINLDAC